MASSLPAGPAQQKNFPELKLSCGSKPRFCKLAESEAGRKRLMALLDPFEYFWVTDARSEQHWSTIRRQCSKRYQNSHESVLHVLAGVPGTGSLPLLQRFLKMGLDPNMTDRNNETPAHVCSMTGVLELLEGLILCRANPLAKDYLRRTPNDVAACLATGHQADVKDGQTEVNAAWAKVFNDGPHSVAQLAAEEKWFALQNICRRRVIYSEAGKRATYQGKDAVQWAEYHGHSELAQELRYLLAPVAAPPKMTVPRQVAQIPSVAVAPSTSKAVEQSHSPFQPLRSGAASAPSSGAAFVSQVDVNLKQEIEKLKQKLVAAETKHVKREEEMRREMKDTKEECVKLQEELKKAREEWKKESELTQQRMCLVVEHVNHLSSEVRRRSSTGTTAATKSVNKKPRLD